MSQSLSNPGLRCGAAALGVWLLAMAASASDPGYLPLVGPTPLRFQPRRAPPTVELPPLALKENHATDVTAFPTNVANPESIVLTAASRTNAPDQYFLLYPPWYWPAPAWLEPARPGGDHVNPTPSPESVQPARPDPSASPAPPPQLLTPTQVVPRPHTASDLLVVTPQMLVDYFKGAQSLTNAVTTPGRAPRESDGAGFNPP
jgi:hypothetical protein